MKSIKSICLISGGKDSQATAIYLKNKGVDVEYLTSDTQWEDEETYKFIREFMDKLGKPITTLSGISFVDLARKKKRFPSTKARFCTEFLKIRGTIDYILRHDCNIEIYQGIRWEESTNRAEMDKTDDFFKHYFEPYGFDKNGKPKFRTYRKREVLAWCEKYSVTARRPIIAWTLKEVFNYIIDNGFLPNKLYQYGFTRVGCFPCIQCTLDEIAKVAEYRPEKIEYIANLEKELNSSFFPPDYIPARYCSQQITKKNKKGETVIVGIPSMMDVITYVNAKGYGSGLFTGSHCQNQMLPCE